MQPSEPAVSNAGGLRRLLGNSLGFRETLGCRDIPAQGLTPPLHPRKGFHPLTRFRWRDPLEGGQACFFSFSCASWIMVQAMSAAALGLISFRWAAIMAARSSSLWSSASRRWGSSSGLWQ